MPFKDFFGQGILNLFHFWTTPRWLRLHFLYFSFYFIVQLLFKFCYFLLIFLLELIIKVQSQLGIIYAVLIFLKI